MNDAPDLSDVFSSTMSAGTRLSHPTLISWPTAMSALFTATSDPSGSSRWYTCPFARLSEMYRLMSSNASLPIDSTSTNASGAMYVNRNPTFRMGMNCVSAVARKYRL